MKGGRKRKREKKAEKWKIKQIKNCKSASFFIGVQMRDAASCNPENGGIKDTTFRNSFRARVPFSNWQNFHESVVLIQKKPSVDQFFFSFFNASDFTDST